MPGRGLFWMPMKVRLQTAFGRDAVFSAPVTALLSGLLAAVVAMVLYRLGPPQHQLKAGLGVAAIAVLVTATLRPTFALGLVVALIPFEYVVYGLGSDEVLIFSAAAVLIWRIQARYVPWWVVLASFALVMGSLLTVVGAHDQGSALWGAARWLGVLILLAAGFCLLRDQAESGRRLVDIITCSAVVVVGFAFLQRAGIYVIVAPPFQPGQISSTFGYYTVYGGFVGMAAVLATGEALRSVMKGHRVRAIVYSIALMVILLGVAVSLSRGAVLCLGAGWVALLILNIRRLSLLIRGLALVAVFVAAGYVATPATTRTQLIGRFSTPVGSQTEDQQRFALQATGRHALIQHPLGLGYGNFPSYLSAHPAPGIGSIFFHSHELFIQMGLDAGWLGLAGFILLTAGALVGGIRAGLRGDVRSTAFAAALCGLMAQGLYDYLFYEISMVAIWVVLVFGAAHTPALRRASDPSLS